MAPEPEPAPPAGHCEGQATACSATGLVSCDRQAGCFYEDLDCHGTATPCDALTTHTACYWQWGCEWIAE